MAENQIIVYGTSWCGDCWRSKRLLDRHEVDYVWVDIDQDRGASNLVLQINNGNRAVPTIVFPEGDTLTEPSDSQLKARLGLE